MAGNIGTSDATLDSATQEHHHASRSAAGYSSRIVVDFRLHFG